MEYRYKHLSAEDVLTLKRVLRVFAEAFGDLDAYQRAVPRDEYLRALLATPYFIALAAMTTCDEAVGGLAAYLLEKFEQDPTGNLHLRPCRPGAAPQKRHRSCSDQ
jgi:aminoglycoside 3-N-acetyltransferase I